MSPEMVQVGQVQLGHLLQLDSNEWHARVGGGDGYASSQCEEWEGKINEHTNLKVSEQAESVTSGHKFQVSNVKLETHVIN